MLNNFGTCDFSNINSSISWNSCNRMADINHFRYWVVNRHFNIEINIREEEEMSKTAKKWINRILFYGIIGIVAFMLGYNDRI